MNNSNKPHKTKKGEVAATQQDRLVRSAGDGGRGLSNEETVKKESERERQARLLQAVNSSAAVLLSADEERFESSLMEGMRLMADCMDVDRINIWKNERRDGILHYIKHFTWAEKSGLDTGVKDKTGFSYIESIPPWENKFLNGETINGPLSSLSEIEIQRLSPYGIRSLLVIPIYLQDKFWGFVSFDDCRNERCFTEDEVSILRSGSLMLASAMERHQAKASVREADERTKLMLDATPLCCNLWNKNFDNIDCNEAAVKLFGLKDKKEYLDRFFELSPLHQPDGRLSSEKALENIKKAFSEGRTVFEWMHQKLDGTPMPSEITLVRVKHGNEYIVNGYTRDLREYKKIMKDIEYRDNLLHTVNNIASILLQSESSEFEANLWKCMGMMAESADVDRVYIWENSVKDGQLYASQLYEWSEGAKPQQGNEYVINIPYKGNMSNWEETLSSGKCVNGIVSKMSPSEQSQLGPQGIMSILVVPVFLRDKFWGFVGFDDCRRERIFSENEESSLRSGALLIANALLRHEITLEQRASAAKMEAVITNYTGVIFSVDKHNTITLFNGLYLKNIGVTPSFLEGKNLNVARKKNRHLDIIEKVAKTFEQGPQEWISEIDDKTFRARTSRIYDANGEVSAVVGSLDDITDNFRLQKELEKAAYEAKAASRAKTDFLSNMSHEMRTPMNAIIGMTAIAKSSADIEKKDYCLGKIEGASAHLLGVINDILDMSKIEANKFTLSLVEFSFEKMLQKVVNVINFRIDEKHQDFVVHIDNAIPDSLIGDDQRLAQVLTNLLANAVKFTPENGSVRLNASLLNEKNGRCTLQIEVADTGIGISKEQQARLFTSFQQAESSTSRKFGGTGLGLAICKNIIEMMDGRIWVESELNKGSSFKFTVQLKRGTQKPASIPKIAKRFRNLRVLVVDDSSEVLDYFTEILKRTNINCSTALSGKAAAGMIKKNGPYDIYFVDWKMPDMNGIELTRMIKTNDAGKSVVIMISSTEWAVIEDDAKAAGVDKFLPKPLFPSIIIDCINECIGNESLSAAGKESADEESGRFDGYCMLLAEDMEINREIVIEMLEKTGIQIDCAENGTEAVKMFSENPDRYDMIFMDIQMPEIDGLEATRRIRALNFKKAAAVPIVAMTANVFREDIEKCINAGMDDHLGKPLNFDEVMQKIQHYANSGKSKRS